MRSRGRLTALLAAMTTATVLHMPAAAGALGGAGDAAATGGVEVVRYAGADTYEQSLAIARATVAAKGGTSEWVVLASGESWTHAAVAGPLAASLDAPVLLMPPGGLQTPTEHLDIASFLESARITRAVVVGSLGPAPMRKPSRQFGSGMLPPNVEHVWGDNPAALSVAAARRLGTPAAFGDRGPTVIIASDRSVADAVAVGPLAAAGPFPLLLTAPEALDPRITAYLAEHEIAHVLLVGGTAAIAPTVQEAIEAADITVTRLAGRDRGDTAHLVADLFERHTADDPACADHSLRVGLASARQPRFALMAGALLARQCISLRYTEPDQLPADLRNTLFLASHHPDGARVVALADEAQLPDNILVPSVPPALLAFSAGWPAGHPRHGQAAVAIVDELGDWRRYPVGTAANRGYLGDVFEWSPDGRFVAYVDAYLDNPRLVVIDTVSDEVAEASVEGQQVLFSGWHRPVWSLDSTQLAFAAFPGDASTLASWDTGSDDGPYIYPTAEMYAFDTQTGETTRLTHNATSDEPSAWSPDGRSIAFAQAKVDIGLLSIVRYSTSLRVLELETGSVTDIYSRANANPDVHWAPDGSHIAFAGYGLLSELSELHEESRVFLARSDGSSVEELTTGGNWGQIVGWAADSSEVHYSSHPPFDYWQASELARYSIRNVESGEDTVVADLDAAVSESLVRVHPNIRGRSPRVRGVPDSQRLLAEITRDDRLVVHSDARPQRQVILDFADRANFVGHFVDDGSSCSVTWTDVGIRGRCEHWRDF